MSNLIRVKDGLFKTLDYFFLYSVKLCVFIFFSNNFSLSCLVTYFFGYTFFFTSGFSSRWQRAHCSSEIRHTQDNTNIYNQLNTIRNTGSRRETAAIKSSPIKRESKNAPLFCVCLAFLFDVTVDNCELVSNYCLKHDKMVYNSSKKEALCVIFFYFLFYDVKTVWKCR